MTNSSFSNPNLHPSQFPEISTLSMQPLSPKYASISRLLRLGVTLILCLFTATTYVQPLISLPDELANLLPYLVWLIGLLGLFMTYYGYECDIRKFYALRELDLHYSSGLLFHKLVSQPITRIQHIELKRGPIERKAGLATLQVFSAGGEMHTFQIPGLPLEQAKQLRQFILQHKELVKHG